MEGTSLPATAAASMTPTNSIAKRKCLLPKAAQEAWQTMAWNNLNKNNPPCPMHYKSLEEMRVIRATRSGGIMGTDNDEMDALDLMQALSQAAVSSEVTTMTTTATAAAATKAITKNDMKYLAQIATALLLLGNGYMDEAHNLVLSLSWRSDLPYAYGPPVNLEDNEPLQTLACYAHCLVHRMEGPNDSEYGMTGFANADFWAGNTMRYLDGLDTLPLLQIRQGVMDLVDSEEAQDFVHQAFQKGDLGVWDPRVLTELCRQVICTREKTGKEHPLNVFAERAALLELRLILGHVLTIMGFEVAMPVPESTPKEA